MLLLEKGFTKYAWFSFQVTNTYSKIIMCAHVPLQFVRYRLKVSKNQKQIVQPKLLKKTNQRICFSILISSQDRKNNSLACVLEEVLAENFAFNFLLTFR